MFNEVPVVPAGEGSCLCCGTPTLWPLCICCRAPCSDGSNTVLISLDTGSCSELVWGPSPEPVSGLRGALLAFDVPVVQTGRGGLMHNAGLCEEPVSELGSRRFGELSACQMPVYCRADATGHPMVQAQPPLLQLAAARGSLLWLWGYRGPHTPLCAPGASLPLALFSPCPACSGQLCRVSPEVPACPSTALRCPRCFPGQGLSVLLFGSPTQAGGSAPWPGCSTGSICSPSCQSSSSGIHTGGVVLGHSPLGTGALLAKPCSGTGWGVDPGVMH